MSHPSSIYSRPGLIATLTACCWVFAATGGRAQSEAGPTLLGVRPGGSSTAIGIAAGDRPAEAFAPSAPVRRRLPPENPVVVAIRERVNFIAAGWKGPNRVPHQNLLAGSGVTWAENRLFAGGAWRMKHEAELEALVKDLERGSLRGHVNAAAIASLLKEFRGTIWGTWLPGVYRKYRGEYEAKQVVIRVYSRIWWVIDLGSPLEKNSPFLKV